MELPTNTVFFLHFEHFYVLGPWPARYVCVIKVMNKALHYRAPMGRWLPFRPCRITSGHNKLDYHLRKIGCHENGL